MANKIKCSDFVARYLSENGISHVYDLAGGMIVNFEDSVSRTKGISCFPMHHEQAAGFAAEGYARISQNFGVAMATSGPGATNLLTAVGSCFFDSTPSLFITGQVDASLIRKHEKIRQNGFQETDIVALAAPITKYAKFIRDASEVVYELEKAVFIAKHGRPGPVLLDFPYNIQTAIIDTDASKKFLGSKEHRSYLKEYGSSEKSVSKKIRQLEAALTRAKAPVIVAGNGIRLSNTAHELESFAQRVNAPVVSSLMGVDSSPASQKNRVGFIGSFGNRDANMILANADLIIALGSRLDIRQTGVPWLFAKKALVIHVDIDKYSINNEVKAGLWFHMGLKDFFAATQTVKQPPKAAWQKFIAAVKNRFSRTDSYPKDFVDPNTFMKRLSQIASSRTNVIVDVGQNQMWLAQSWEPKKGQRILFSGGMGVMGFALPAAIGAYCADPKKDLWVICGDGGLQINIQEMETVKRNRIPMKLFIINNRSLGMVRDSQGLYFKNNYQSTIKGYGVPDLKRVARAYGFGYMAIRSLKAEDGQIKKAVASPGPILIEVMVDQFHPLQPKVVFGKPLDEQSPSLSDEDVSYISGFKKALFEI